ncbi:MAG: RagB/SusD family nutrient uptake outer membrane protein [Flavobacteriaceae bacterium]|jgi:hypothetical protein|nr:RagB/SusD family nutrient uptake outer membrane protein [Flavobacteriaceae bacterium]
MKLIKILTAISIVLFSFTACSDSFLEEFPVNSTLTEDAIKNKTDLATAVNGVYGRMIYFTANTDVLTVNELLADHAFVGIDNSNRFTSTDNWKLFLTPDNAYIRDIWRAPYFFIDQCNTILATESTIVSDEDTENWYAQTRAIRAYYYLILLSYFSPNYGEGNDEYGVPMPETTDVWGQLPRKTVTEGYNFVLNELLTAYNVFDKINKPNETNKIGKSAVELLLARTYLFMKDYPNAEIYAQKVLDEGNLLEKTQVASYFPQNLLAYKETLFAIQVTGAHFPGQNDVLSATWSSLGTYKQNWMVKSFYDSFAATDVRKGTWYQDNAYVQGLQDNPKPIDVRKYNTYLNSIMQLRRTEAIFIEAEALYHTNQSAAGTTLEDWVKTYRDSNYKLAVSSGEPLLNEILNQKAFEFFLEGQRLLDLKRNHLPVVNPQTQTNISGNDGKFVWPIPRGELNANKNIIQYPEYK